MHPVTLDRHPVFCVCHPADPGDRCQRRLGVRVRGPGMSYGFVRGPRTDAPGL